MVQLTCDLIRVCCTSCLQLWCLEVKYVYCWQRNPILSMKVIPLVWEEHTHLVWN